MSWWIPAGLRLRKAVLWRLQHARETTPVEKTECCAHLLEEKRESELSGHPRALTGTGTVQVLKPNLSLKGIKCLPSFGMEGNWAWCGSW